MIVRIHRAKANTAYSYRSTLVDTNTNWVDEYEQGYLHRYELERLHRSNIYNGYRDKQGEVCGHESVNMPLE